MRSSGAQLKTSVIRGATVCARRLTGRFRFVALLAAVVVSAAALFGGSVFAASNGNQLQGFFGAVIAENSGSFDVETNAGTQITLLVATSTQFEAPDGSSLTLKDIPLGAKVGVLAQGSGNVLTALQVMPESVTPAWQHKVVTVAQVSNGIATGVDDSGQVTWLELGANATSSLVGQVVTVIGREDNGQFKVNSIVSISQQIDRLQNLAGQLLTESQHAQTASQRGQAAAQFQVIKTQLQAAIQDHLNLVNAALSKVSIGLKVSLETQLQRTQARYVQTLISVGDSKAAAVSTVRQQTAVGTIAQFDRSNGRIQLNIPDRGSLELSVGSSTVVEFESGSGTIEDLAPDQRVIVRYSRDSGLVSQIRVQTQTQIEGVVTVVDTRDGKLTLKPDAGTTTTVSINSSTRITVDGKKAGLGQIQPDMTLTATVQVPANIAVALAAEDQGVVAGTIESVNPKDGAISVLTKGGATVNFTVTDRTRIEQEGLAFSIFGLATGSPVQIRFDLATGRALDIRQSAREASSTSSTTTTSEVQGTIYQVSPGSGTLTVTQDNGQQMGVATGTSTTISLDGRRVGLSSLSAGNRVQIHIGDRTQAKGSGTQIATSIDAFATKLSGDQGGATSTLSSIGTEVR